jgi:hypothetical protein
MQTKKGLMYRLILVSGAFLGLLSGALCTVIVYDMISTGREDYANLQNAQRWARASGPPATQRILDRHFHLVPNTNP